ncbi:MAG: hypothetical protein A3J83_00510 [Elusimicrobia bacterium RIFOXYA2_FULL_40_6]|nr:MAG: hypothetical protein A3J83_00510 [Elusimicrobia bacterium RIFOXYA2_FULL_40_6]
MENNQTNLIRAVYPEIEGGKYPVKTEIDRPFIVTAFVHSELPKKVSLTYRKKGAKTWKKVSMNQIDYPRWKASILFDKVGIYEYTVEVMLSETKEKVFYKRNLEVWVEPVNARFAAWYEMFHWSQGKIPCKCATFKDMEARLPDIKKMGFDVIYLPPIHPVGITNKKGPNNSLNACATDPGCPWSIGNEHGGHKSVNPDLGTLEDFRKFIKKCDSLGMPVAIDIAFTCSYDHPYIKEHPGWFFYNPDGTIKYAENPPKKYQDTVPFNWYPKDKQTMWQEFKTIFIFWIEQGVKIFRIDNPHTKPDEFWGWVIKEVKKEHPETLFLSEAFTVYEKMELLAKLGFTQSYTYFTWRNGKNDLIEYISKLTNSYLRDFLRGNFFANTPDILPKYLQTGGRPAFKVRAVLASTLSSVYGIYNGFELCENAAIPGKEEYLNSEKYEYKVWDWDRPGNIKDYIGKLNKIRKENTALHSYDNLKIYNSTDDNVLFYGKTSEDKSNIILVAVNVDPFNTQKARVTVPLEDFGIASDGKYRVLDLLNDKEYIWQGRENNVILDPQNEPAHVFRLEKM